MVKTIDEKLKRKQISVYFTNALPGSITAVACILIAILAFMLFSVVASSNLSAPISGVALVILLVMGLPLLILVVYILYVLNNIPEDSQVDTWFKEETDILSKRALKVLGVQGEFFLAAPVVIYKPVMWKAKEISDENINKKKGKDGLLRFSAWKYMVFVFTDKRLGCYMAMYDFMKGEATKETTEEFYYTDIVRVGTDQEKVVLLHGEEVTIEQFVLKVSSGDSVSVRDVTKLYETEKNKVIPTAKLEEVVSTIRKILEQTK